LTTSDRRFFASTAAEAASLLDREKTTVPWGTAGVGWDDGAICALPTGGPKMAIAIPKISAEAVADDSTGIKIPSLLIS
jgi:hypothetical protein